MRLRIIMAAVATLAAAVLFLAGCQEPPKGSLKTGSATDFTLKNTEGKAVSLSDFRGKVVILDFWATWCPPCRDAVPELIELQETYRDRDFTVLAVTVNDTVENARSFVKEFAVNYPVLLDEDKRVMDQYRVAQVPTTFVLGKDGKVKNKYFGFAPGIKEKFIEDIEKQLQGTSEN